MLSLVINTPSIFSPSVIASCHSILSTLHTLLYSTTTFYSLHTSPQQQPHHTTKPQIQSKCPSLVLPSSSAVLPSLVSDTTSTPLVETQELLRRRLRVRATTLYTNDSYTNLIDRRRSQRCCRHQEAPPWPHSWRRGRVERSWCQDRRCCKSMIYPSRHTQISISNPYSRLPRPIALLVSSRATSRLLPKTQRPRP